MSIVQMPRDPAITAMEADVAKYGTPLGQYRRYPLQLIASHFKIPYPTGATKDQLIEILRGNDITIDKLQRSDTDPATGLLRTVSIVPEIMHRHITRFDRLREEAVAEFEEMMKDDDPRKDNDPVPRKSDYAIMGWNELRTLAKDRGCELYGKKRGELISMLEAMDGQNAT